MSKTVSRPSKRPRRNDTSTPTPGPRQVLFNLLDRKWISRPRFCTDSREDAAGHLAGVLEALRAHRSAPMPAAMPGAHEVREWPQA